MPWFSCLKWWWHSFKRRTHLEMLTPCQNLDSMCVCVYSNFYGWEINSFYFCNLVKYCFKLDCDVLENYWTLLLNTGASWSETVMLFTTWRLPCKGCWHYPYDKNLTQLIYVGDSFRVMVVKHIHAGNETFCYVAVGHNSNVIFNKLCSKVSLSHLFQLLHLYY
jgi:hypothetical protein